MSDLDATYPAQLHIRKLVDALLNEIQPHERKEEHVIYLQGQHTTCRDDTDRELPFRQEANFHYLTGCLVPSSSLIIRIAAKDGTPEELAFSSSRNIQSKLYIPEEDPDVTLWSVAPPTLEAARKTYDFPDIKHTLTSDAEWLKELVGTSPPSSSNPTLHIFDREDYDYPKPPSLFDDASLKQDFFVSTARLQRALHFARLIKTPLEIAYIREACRISSGAHEVVMRELGRFARRRGQVSKGDGEAWEEHAPKRTGKEQLSEWEVESEADAEAVFVACCKRSGAAQAYLPIVASGTRASTLHYVCNDRIFPTSSPAGGNARFASRGCCGQVPPADAAETAAADASFMQQVLLIDAGCEYRGGYASDITRTIPVGNGGKFTTEARAIYQIVLRMQKAAEALVKPGVHWDSLHLLCHRILCEEFLALGIFKDATVDELLAASLSLPFFPHGLGHSLGLDVHDSLQLLRSEHLGIGEEAIKYAPLFRYLRIRRQLEEGMVLTIEPGCYFSPNLLKSHGIYDSPLVDQEVLARFAPVGGVRIEDVITVTSSGCDNLTTVGREVDWIESVCSGA